MSARGTDEVMGETTGKSPAAAGEHPTLHQQARNSQNVAASGLAEPDSVATLQRQLEEQEARFERLQELLERQRRMDLLHHLLMILCPPAAISGRGSSAASLLAEERSPTSDSSNAAMELGEPVELGATDSVSAVLFTVALLRSDEDDLPAAGATDATLKRLFMTNAHILGRAEIGRFLAQEGEACRGLKKMLDSFIVEEQGTVCRNIVKMVKGFELAMDEHAFTFVPDFDADSEYAWKVHVFDRDYVVDVTTANCLDNCNEAEELLQRTTECPVDVGGDTDEIPDALTASTRYFYTLNRLDGRRIDFQNRVSIRCLLVRSLSAFYVNHELTEAYLEHLLQWAPPHVDSTMEPSLESAEPQSSIELIGEWLERLPDG